MLVLAAVVLLWLGARSPAARAADAGTLAHQISTGQNRVSALSGAVGADNGRLRQLDAGISGLQSKIARIQSDLDAKRAELLQLRRELNAARVRLAGLKTYERRAMYVLSQQLPLGAAGAPAARVRAAAHRVHHHRGDRGVAPLVDRLVEPVQEQAADPAARDLPSRADGLGDPDQPAGSGREAPDAPQRRHPGLLTGGGLGSGTTCCSPARSAPTSTAQRSAAVTRPRP